MRHPESGVACGVKKPPLCLLPSPCPSSVPGPLPRPSGGVVAQAESERHLGLLNSSCSTALGLLLSLEAMMLKLKLQYFGHLMRNPTHWKRS